MIPQTWDGGTSLYVSQLYWTILRTSSAQKEQTWLSRKTGENSKGFGVNR